MIFKRGDEITLDGSTGEVIIGNVPKIQPEVSGDFASLMVWVDQFRRLKVRTNADTPRDSKVAREFGAEGIGLCRTEHMFFEGGDRIQAVREMILADDLDGRKRALDKILPMQKSDFLGIFREMKGGLPVTIRYLIHLSMSSYLKQTMMSLNWLNLLGYVFQKLKITLITCTSSIPCWGGTVLPPGHYLS